MKNIDMKLQEVVREMAEGTQEEMDRKMNNIAAGIFEKLQERYPEAPIEETEQFAKDIAVAHIRATASTMKKGS